VQPLENVIQGGQRLRGLAALDEEQTWKTREKVLQAERTILATIDYQVNVEHAHAHAAGMASGEVLQIAKSFLNDSLTTGSCLAYAPRLTAAAAVSLAMRFLKKERPAQDGEVFGFSQEELAPVEVHLLKIYDEDESDHEKKRVKV